MALPCDAEWQALGLLERLDRCAIHVSQHGLGVNGWVLGFAYLRFALVQLVFLVILFIRAPSAGMSTAEGAWQAFVRYAIFTHVLLFFGEKDGPPRRWTGGIPYLFGAFAGARYRLTRGALKEPLFSFLNNRVSTLDIFINAVYLVASSIAVCSRHLQCWLVLLVAMCIVWNAFSNYNGYLQGQGPSYLPLILCGCYPLQQGLMFAQITMMIVWIGSGLAKMGPWFASVNGTFLCSSFWLSGQHWLWALMYRSSEDLRPTRFATVLAYLAATVEWGAPLLLLVRNPQLIWTGIILLAAMHMYIVLLCNVNLYVWNFFFAVATVGLFRGCGTMGFDFDGLAVAPFPLMAFTAFQIALFFWGSLSPDSVAYQSAHRYWAGNWPASVFLIKKDAAHKFTSAVPTFGRPAWDPLPGWIKRQRWLNQSPSSAEMATCKALAFFSLLTLNLKYLPSLLQRFLGSSPISDYYVLHSSYLFDMLFGFGMSCDANRSASVTQSIQDLVNFEEGEFSCLLVGGFSAFGQSCSWGKARWKIIDAKIGIVDHGSFSVQNAQAVAALPSSCEKLQPLLQDGH